MPMTTATPSRLLDGADYLHTATPRLDNVRMLVVGFCFAWATTASVGFLSTLVPENRRALAAYPVFLFYLSISWMVLVQ